MGSGLLLGCWWFWVVAMVLLGSHLRVIGGCQVISGALGWLLRSCWVVLVGSQGVARNLLGNVCGC